MRTKLIITMERDRPIPGGAPMRIRTQRLFIVEDELHSAKFPGVLLEEAVVSMERALDNATTDNAD